MCILRQNISSSNIYSDIVRKTAILPSVAVCDCDSSWNSLPVLHQRMKSTTKMTSQALPTLFSGLALCVYILLMTAHSTEGWCLVQGDMMVAVGASWEERCNQCVCTEDGTKCQGPTCALPYNWRQELTCAEWDESNCCCIAEGCRLPDGIIVPLGEPLPVDPKKPCVSCTCKPERMTCVSIRCPFCPNPIYRDGQCCPDCPARTGSRL